MEKQTAQLRRSQSQEKPPLTSVSEEHSSRDSNHTFSEEQSEYSYESNSTFSEEQLEYSYESNIKFSEEQLDRPYSPLPPLTIEIIPKIDKHDEPEEYYTRLEEKMIKLYYRRSEHHKDVNNRGSVELEENDVPDIPESIEEGESHNVEVAMSPRVFIAARRSLNTPPPPPGIAAVSDIIDDKNESTEVSESQNIEAARSSGMSVGRASDKSANTDIDNSNESTETVKSHEIEVLESPTTCVTTGRASDKSVTATVSDNTDYHIELAEDVESQNFEVMRSPRECVSAGSIQNEPDDDSHQNITEVREREEVRIESASTEESIQSIVDCDEPIDSNVNLRSPILGQKNTYENVAGERLRKRSRSPSFSRNKRRRYSDVGVQTDFDDVNPRILSEEIFMGTPRVFNLNPSRLRQLFESILFRTTDAYETGDR